MDQEQSQKQNDQGTSVNSPKSLSAPSAFRGRLALVLALSAFGMAAASLLFTYQQSKQTAKTDANLSEQALKLSEFGQIKQQLGESSGRQEQNLAQVQAQLDHLRMTTSADSESWTLSEVEYLLRLANFNLLYDENVVVGKKILNAADLRIKDLSSASLNSVRTAIANDLATLEAIPVVDQEGLIVRLSALSKMTESLPITDHKSISPKQVDVPASNVEQPKWRQAFNNSLAKLKDAVVIRRIDQPLQPLLSPEQHANLINNIQFQFSLASWAVLHRDSKLYNLSLTQVSEWVTQYLKESDNTKALLTAIDQLKTINVAPHVPNIDNSLRAVAAAIVQKSQLQRQQVPTNAPTTPPLQNQQPRMLPKENQPEVLSS